MLISTSAIAKCRKALAVVSKDVAAIALAAVWVATEGVVGVAVHLDGGPLAVVVAWSVGLPSVVGVFEGVDDRLWVLQLIRDLPMLCADKCQCCTSVLHERRRVCVEMKVGVMRGGGGGGWNKKSKLARQRKVRDHE